MYDTARKASDHFEHGSADLPTVRKAATHVTEKIFWKLTFSYYLRRCGAWLPGRRRRSSCVAACYGLGQSAVRKAPCTVDMSSTGGGHQLPEIVVEQPVSGVESLAVAVEVCDRITEGPVYMSASEQMGLVGQRHAAELTAQVVDLRCLLEARWWRTQHRKQPGGLSKFATIQRGATSWRNSSIGARLPGDGTARPS